MTDARWKEALASSTGQWAFVLSLSRTMVFFLAIIRDGTYFDAAQNDEARITRFHVRNRFISGTNSLKNRGLIEEVLETYEIHGKKEWRVANWILTPAGEAVCQLLVFAGLMAEAKPKKAKRAA